MKGKRKKKSQWRRGWLPSPVFLPGGISWTEDLGGLKSMRSQRVRHDKLLSTRAHTHTHTHTLTTSLINFHIKQKRFKMLNKHVE